MICAGCDREIPETLSYFAVFYEQLPEHDHAQVRIVGGCVEHPVPKLDEARAVFGSGGCLLDYLHDCMVEEPS